MWTLTGRVMSSELRGGPYRCWVGSYGDGEGGDIEEVVKFVILSAWRVLGTGWLSVICGWSFG